jgi:alkanesulfonate monooxygenase SsuD/methylene tetrahydromethanopterin reductase-like flavin-dependent oxidoreductase (luciferase family)
LFAAVAAFDATSEMFKTSMGSTSTLRVMKVGIGLPAAVPDVDATVMGPWAAQSEGAGFSSLGVIDRLVYDNLDPLVALAAAAACTERVEMLTTVLNVGYRRNPIVLAKQIASVDQLSGGRLTVGLALGGWPEDYAVSDASLSARGATFDDTLAAMRQVWSGAVSGASGPMPALPTGHPRVLIGGLVAASFTRAASHGDGWVAPSFGMQVLKDGITSARRAWREAGRHEQPRIVVERYFSLGDGANEIADHYLMHYYGSEYFAAVRADALTSPERIRDELQRLAEAGCDDVVLLPCSAELDQVGLLADTVSDSFKTTQNPFATNET